MFVVGKMTAIKFIVLTCCYYFSNRMARENWSLFREEYLLWKIIRENEFDSDMFAEMSTEYRDFSMFTITVSFKTATSIDDSFRFDVRSRTLEEKRTYLPTNTFQMVEEIFGRIALEKKKEWLHPWKNVNFKLPMTDRLFSTKTNISTYTLYSKLHNTN